MKHFFCFLSKTTNLLTNILKKELIIFFIFILAICSVPCQGMADSIEIRGTISNSPFHQISIHCSGMDSFVIFEYYTINIKGNSFAFKGLIKSSSLVRLYIDGNNSTYLSDEFYVDAGVQNLIVKIDGDKIDVDSDAISFKEYQTKFEKFRDSLKVNNNVIDKDSILYFYSLLNPTSSIGMMEFYISISGYRILYENIFENFSTSLQKSYLGKKIIKKLKLHKSVEVGNYFPEMSLYDINDKAVQLKSITKDKYIIIDFWHHACGFCINEFPQIKELFIKFYGKHFNIISISTDLTRFRNKWKEAIIKHQMPNEQYIDLNGVRSKELGISYFPQTFLLDESCKIIGKNFNVSNFYHAINLISEYRLFSIL